MDFVAWLQKEKKLSKKSAYDVKSRLGRALIMTTEKEATKESICILEGDEVFKSLSISVKSHLRRAVRLYLEYKERVNI